MRSLRWLSGGVCTLMDPSDDLSQTQISINESVDPVKEIDRKRSVKEDGVILKA